MEFGLFFNGYLPGPAAHDQDAEHLMLMREVEYAIPPQFPLRQEGLCLPCIALPKTDLTLDQ